MNKTDLSKVAKLISKKVSMHSPEILTSLGIVGMITTTVLAVKATPKALKLIEERETNNKIEVVKCTWKCYAPSVLLGTISTACLIGASSVNTRRTAALATAYKLSETALTEYREKVVEVIGEKKAKDIRDKVAEEQIKKHPINDADIIITERGNTLCLDTISGQYFKSDIDKIKKAENELNRRMFSEMYISLNELYMRLGLRTTTIGADLGWNMDDGYLEFYFSSQLTEQGEPCLVLDYKVAPKYDFSSLEY